METPAERAGATAPRQKSATSEIRYRDRRHGGRVLASALAKYAGRDDVVVLALPRGGVPVAYEVAKGLRAPLDVFIVRKLGLPGDEEIAMGAIASGGVRVLNADIVDGLDISSEVIDAVADAEQKELERRERAYRSDRRPIDVEDRIVVLVDDGLATGSTMSAAVEGVKRHNPRRVVVAVPIASPATCEEIAEQVDEIVCAATPEPFLAVGLWYADFEQTSDDEVRALLNETRVFMDPERPRAAKRPRAGAR